MMKPYPEKLTADQQRFLKGLFPGDGCLLSPEELDVFGADSSRRFARPLAVVRPFEAGQISELLKWADAERMPIYPRSRGTNMVGGCVPVHGGVVVSALGLNRILDIDPEDFVAEVEPGVVTAELQRQAAKKHLLYPPDPASLRISTIGGNVSTCAGGMRAVKYGVTRDYVLGIEAVLPGGKTISTGGRSHKDVVGLDLTRLLAGSAGTLAFITKLYLKLVPLPEAAASVLAGYSSLEEALNGARAVFRAGILPAACEFMDETTIRAVSAVAETGLPPEARAALIIKIDGSKRTLPGELERLEETLASTGPVFLESGSEEREDAVWEVRRMISPAAFQLRPNKLGEDVAVPRGSAARAVAGYKEIGDRHGLPVLCFGHLGDGNVHVNVMFDALDPEEKRKSSLAKDEIFGLTLDLGGTISGEHGTGLTKADFISRQLGETEMSLMSGIKNVFDPKGIMNPGKGW